MIYIIYYFNCGMCTNGGGTIEHESMLLSFVYR